MTYIYIALAFLALLIGNAADYFYQADLHGWANILWGNGTRAAKWGAFDFIPHDGWHIAQWLRNLCMLIAPIFVTYHIVIKGSIRRVLYEWYYPILFTIGAYILTRGIGFSLLYKLLN